MKKKKKIQVRSPVEQNFEIQKLSLLKKNRHFWSEIIHQVWSEMSKFLSGAEKREKKVFPRTKKKNFFVKLDLNQVATDFDFFIDLIF